MGLEGGEGLASDWAWELRWTQAHLATALLRRPVAQCSEFISVHCGNVQLGRAWISPDMEVGSPLPGDYGLPS